MPELPEVEQVRRTLMGHLVGQTVAAVTLHRADIVHGPRSPGCLLQSHPIRRIVRHGKQLALVAADPDRPGQGPCLCVHLGMTGSLRFRSDGIGHQGQRSDHLHAIWHLDGGGRLEFCDPRRFGGLWTFANRAQLIRRRWSRLGTDATVIRPMELYRRLSRSRRPVKSALLDQTIVAGLGNIYVDELLFRCRLHPGTACCALDLARWQHMVRTMRRLLAQAIACGGSSVRDYRDANGRQGRFQLRHRVYGRQGRSCCICRTFLQAVQLAGRTTVLCPNCQR